MQEMRNENETRMNSFWREIEGISERQKHQWNESMKGLEAAAEGVGAACQRANQAIDSIHQVVSTFHEEKGNDSSVIDEASFMKCVQLRGDLHGVWEETAAEARALATVQGAQDRMAQVMTDLHHDTREKLAATSKKAEASALNFCLKTYLFLGFICFSP